MSKRSWETKWDPWLLSLPSLENVVKVNDCLWVTLGECVFYVWCFLPKSRVINNPLIFHICQTFSSPNFHTLHSQSPDLVHHIFTSWFISLSCTSIPRSQSIIQSRRRTSPKTNSLDAESFGIPSTNSCSNIGPFCTDITIIFMVIEMSLMLVRN